MAKRKIKVLKITPHQEIAVLNTKGNCYIAVSVNNDFYKDKENVSALLKFIKEHFFNCTIVVADFLYRHNLKIIKSNKKQILSTNTDELGEKIIDFLNPLIENDLDFFEIKRWKDYYSSKEFIVFKKKVMEMYHSDIKFKSSILNTAKSFVQRLEKNQKLLIKDINIAVNHSVEFILEEIIVFCILADKGLNIDIYPGTYLQVLKDISLGEFPISPVVLKNRISVEIKAIRKKPVANNV